MLSEYQTNFTFRQIICMSDLLTVLLNKAAQQNNENVIEIYIDI